MDQTSKWVFIINPTAGNGYAGSLEGKIKEQITRHNLSAEVVFTQRRGHGTELSQYYADRGYRYIIAVGGDGTLNEIASPLIFRKEVVLGLVGAGTGNDFIQITGFPGRFKDSDWDAFFRANTTLMDIGKCNDRIFLNGMGLGFDAQVAAENYTEPGEVKPGGKSKYIWHILKPLLLFKEKRMVVITNGQTIITDCFMNTIANGRRFAGGFYLTPEALANDGLLDVCAIKEVSLPQRLKILLMVPKGTHINDKRVHYYKTEKLSLEFPSEVPFHVDGELYFSKDFEVTTLPGALNIIYNPEGRHYFNN